MLVAYTGQAKYETPAVKALASLQGPMSQYPGAFAHWLGALEFVLAPPKEIAIIGPLDREDTTALLQASLMPYHPHQVVAAVNENEIDGHPELVEARPMQEGKATVYVCQKFACQKPVTTVKTLEALL
jgi:uncharacterized protein YyaL (SSP411 family)